MDSVDRDFPEEKGCAPLETQPASSLVGSDAAIDKATPQTAQAGPLRRTIRRAEWRSIGCPVISLEFWSWQTSVKVTRPPWGMERLDKDFLGRGRRSAERYADSLADEFSRQADARVRYFLHRKARNAAGREISRLLDQPESER